MARFFWQGVVLLATRRRKYDVVHFGDLVLFPLAVWHRVLAPERVRVFTVYGLDLLYGRQPGWKPALYRVFLAMARTLAGTAQRYIAISRNTGRLSEEAGFVPTSIVPLAVRVAEPGARGVPAGTPSRYLFCFGRVVARKGLKWFAEHVLPQLPEDVVLLAAGKVWDQRAMPTDVPTGRFRHLGVIEADVLQAYCRHAAAVVVPNLPSEDSGDAEGFGLVNLEAAAHGGVVLAANVEGIPDAVEEGITGFLLPPGQVAPWVAKVNEVLQWTPEDRRSYSERARVCLREKFSWERVAQATAQVYRECLAKG